MYVCTCLLLVPWESFLLLKTQWTTSATEDWAKKKWLSGFYIPPYFSSNQNFCVDLPDKLVSQVVNKVIYLIPVMLHTARPEEKIQGRPINCLVVSWNSHKTTVGVLNVLLFLHLYFYYITFHFMTPVAITV